MLNSLRKGLLISTVLVSCLSVIAASTVLSWLHYQQARAALLAQTQEYAVTLAVSVNQQLAHHPQSLETAFAQLLSENTRVLNAHVYVYDEQQLGFLTSYNRAGVQPIAARPEQATALRKPRLQAQGVDIMVPIERFNSFQGNGTPAGQPEVRGYLFLRADHSGLTELVQRSALIVLATLLVAIVMALLLASLLSHFFGKPLRRLIDITRDVARTRNYGLRANTGSFHELDLFALNFNTVLERIQQYIRQHEKAEAAAQQLTAELEQQVQDRTTALRNANQELLETLEQLHQHQGRQVEAQKMSSLSELVAGISHEINTPLGMAVTAASMVDNSLQQTPVDVEKAVEQMDILQRNLTRSVELINNFKKLAIEHAGEDATEVDVGQLMDDIVTSAHAQISETEKLNVQVRSSVQGMAKLKIGVWQQIISSLMENSAIHGFADARYSVVEKGLVEIELREEQGRLVVHYKDQGCGVPADILRRIFDPFVTSKRGHGNSGLGMHLIYNLVTHTLNGTVQCLSAPDEGFEVIIQCPLERGSED